MIVIIKHQKENHFLVFNHGRSCLMFPEKKLDSKTTMQEAITNLRSFLGVDKENSKVTHLMPVKKSEVFLLEVEDYIFPSLGECFWTNGKLINSPWLPADQRSALAINEGRVYNIHEREKV